jgi:amyloid beta precursor protein binding protein 1
VGSFTIVDGKKVDESDLGHNFFVDAGSIGKSRADVTRQLLNELNDLVIINAVEKDPVALIQESPEFFANFTLVIASNVPEQPLLQLGAICFKHNITLLSIRSYGLIGYLRVVVPEHTGKRPSGPKINLCSGRIQT